jgi:hypothetical protein
MGSGKCLGREKGINAINENIMNFFFKERKNKKDIASNTTTAIV